jgi:hypothetical protein
MKKKKDSWWKVLIVPAVVFAFRQIEQRAFVGAVLQQQNTGPSNLSGLGATDDLYVVFANKKRKTTGTWQQGSAKRILPPPPPRIID